MLCHFLVAGLELAKSPIPKQCQNKNAILRHNNSLHSPKRQVDDDDDDEEGKTCYTGASYPAVSTSQFSLTRRICVVFLYLYIVLHCITCAVPLSHTSVFAETIKTAS